MGLSDESLMKLALLEASKAYDSDEVPIGCLIVRDGKVIAKAHNLREGKNNVLAHAEIVAINRACKKLNEKFLENCIIYVTIEPCLMCLGAILQARMKKIVYGAKEPKFGCLGSVGNPLSDYKFNHQIEIQGGLLEKECSQLMKDFFKGKR